jgi:hypothetical protein
VGHVDDEVLVEAVAVVVVVTGREPEHRVAGCGQERTCIVDGEVTTRMTEHDGGLPRRVSRWCPQDAADDEAVRRDERDRLAAEREAGVVGRIGPEPEDRLGHAP